MYTHCDPVHKGFITFLIVFVQYCKTTYSSRANGWMFTGIVFEFVDNAYKVVNARDHRTDQCVVGALHLEGDIMKGL